MVEEPHANGGWLTTDREHERVAHRNSSGIRDSRLLAAPGCPCGATRAGTGAAESGRLPEIQQRSALRIPRAPGKTSLNSAVGSDISQNTSYRVICYSNFGTVVEMLSGRTAAREWDAAIATTGAQSSRVCPAASLPLLQTSEQIPKALQTY